MGLVEDIVVRETPRAVYVLNAVSRGLTRSLPFGEHPAALAGKKLAASAAVAVWARSPRTARAAPRSAVSYGPSGASLRRPPGPSEPPASGGFGGVSLSRTRRHGRSTPSHRPLGGNQPAGRRYQ